MYPRSTKKMRAPPRCKKTDGTEVLILDLVEQHTKDGQYGSSPMLFAVRQMVRALQRGELSLENALQRSYRHKNGFLKVVLADHAGRKLRFHSYLPDEGDENIHDHRWAMMHSMVLDGALPAQYLQVAAPEEEGAIRYIDHEYRKVGEDYRVTERGEAFLKVHDEAMHVAGTTYSMTSRQLHRILASEAPAATLVFTEPVPVERPWCHLYASNAIKESTMGVVHEERLTRGEMLLAIHRLERHLSLLLRMKAVEPAAIERPRGVA